MIGFHNKHKSFIYIAIIFAILAIYLIPLGSHALIEPDEGRYSEIPREMIESGDFITPKLNYIKYFEKPVLHYWMNAISFMLFGQNEFAARLFTASCAILGIIATGALGSFIFGGASGLLSAIITAFSLLYFAIGTINITDMPLSFFITMALVSFYFAHIGENKKWYLLFYASMALGVLTKGLVAIILPGGVIFCYILITRKWKLFIEALYIPGIILFFLISVPWFWLVCKENPDFFHFFFIQEHFLRYATKMHGRYEPFWFFIPMIPAGLMPWTGFLFSLFSKKSILFSPANKKTKDSNIFLLAWFGVILLFYSLSSSKLIPYIVPCIPPLAILIAADISRMVENKRWHGHALLWNSGIALFFSTAFLAYAFFGDRVPSENTLPIAIKTSLGLLIGPFLALLLSHPKIKNFKAAVTALTLSSLIFIYSLLGVYAIIGETRSTKALSEVIIKEIQPEEIIVSYGEVLQGLPFYTKQRVMLVDYFGELEFGGKQKEGDGWFLTKEEFLPEWINKTRSFILVVEKKRMNLLFPDGNTRETKRIEIGDFIVIFNRRTK